MYWGRDNIQKLVCTDCRSLMPLVRREPHPALPPGWELQSFECPVCERAQILTVEMIRQQKAGNVPTRDLAVLDEEKGSATPLSI